MDEHDDSHHEEPSGELPLPGSGRVRIVGAEPVRSVGDDEEPPGGTDEPGAQQEAPGENPWPVGEAPAATLPHWTDAPTGEVPAVLSRPGEDDGGRDPWAALPAPTWREGHADWQAGEETFEPSMLAEDESRIGALDDSGASDRQPWTFDLDDEEVRPLDLGASEETVVVPAVRVIDEPGTRQTGDVQRDAWPQGTPPPGRRPLPLRERLAAESPRAAGPADGLASDERGEPAISAKDDDRPLGASPGVVEEEEGDDEPRPRRAGRRPRTATGRAERRGGRLRGEPPPDDLGAGGRPSRGRPAGATAPTRRPPSSRPAAVGVANGSGPSGARRPAASSGRSGRDLPVAIVSGLAVGALTLVCFDLGTVASLAVVTAVVTLAAVEALAALRRGGYHPATLLGLVAVVSVMVGTYNKGPQAVPLVAVLLVAFVALWHVAGVERGADPLRSSASTLFVFCWIGVFGSYGALLLDPSLFPSRHGIAFLLGAVIAGVACDVGALAVGATMGSHPLAPSVSPNKTWEGVIGGLVASVLASVVVVHLIHPWTLPKAAALGVVVAVVSPVGDLTESLVKRHLGLKDMSRLLPGHGGVLDRVDGLLFVLPATYYLVKALHLG
jgi:CDP-diglyceride synthetase